ncbi:hypothetical protein ACF0H5_007535 [Mactra antiquata]
MLCLFTLPLIPDNVNKCSKSLFLGNKTLINENCEFLFMLNAMQSTLRQLNDTHFLISNISTIDLVSPDKQLSIKGCKFCIITIPCNCSITTASTYIPPRLSYCHHHDVNITSLHHVNLALLQQFFKDSSLSMIQANSTYDATCNISVPQFHLFTHDFSKLVAKDFKEHLNLKKMAEASKNNKQIFTHLVDPLLAMPVKSDNNLSRSNIIIVICSCLTVISSTGIIVLYCKYQKLATAVFGSTLVTSTKAAVLPNFHFTTTEMTALNTSPFSEPRGYQDIVDLESFTF